MRGGRVTAAVGRAVRWSARLIGLVVVVLLVVGIGVGIRSPDVAAPVYSASERAQLNAEARYRTLADVARVTATTTTADPARTELMTAIAAHLDAQADTVVLPRPPVPARGTTTGGASAGISLDPLDPSYPSDPPNPSDPLHSSAAATPGKPDADPARVLVMLRDSALRSLRDAVKAEPGPARVLAAAGANQWRHTVLLAEALGAESGLPPADALPPDAPEDADAPGTGDPVPSECAGAPLGSEADRQALLTAKKAEDQALYGYEVAAALLPDPAGALALSAIHREAADVAADLLTGLCDPAAPAPVGFAIGRAFRADPVTATRELEQDHAELYAGLVSAASSDVVRAWAVASFSAAAQRSLDAGTPLEAFPGLNTDLAGAADGPLSSAVTPVPDTATPTGPTGPTGPTATAPTEPQPTEPQPAATEPTDPTLTPTDPEPTDDR